MNQGNMVLLERFHYDVTHITRKIITHAGGLPRNDHLPEPESCEVEEQAEYIQEMDDEPLANIKEWMDN